MMEKSNQTAFDREFRAHIEPLTASLIATLRLIITTPVPPVVKLLGFEMQPDWREFPVHVFAMDDESPNEVYYEPPFYASLLPHVGPLVPDGAIDQDGYEEAGIHTFERGSCLMVEWFGECWHSAGGAMFPIPAYIHLHDDSDYFELRSRRWVRDTDIWR